MRRRISAARVICILAAGAGCNGILGIEEAFHRPDDAASSDGSGLGDGSSNDGNATDGTLDGGGIDADATSITDGPTTKDVAPDATFPCNVMNTSQIASADASVPNGPTLAYSTKDDVWGLAWNDNLRIRYNVLGANASLGPQLANDPGIVPTLAPNAYASAPRLAEMASGLFVLGVGVLDAGNGYPSAKSIIAFDGGGAAALVPGTSVTGQTQAPDVSGIAITGPSNFAIVSRPGSLTASTQLHAQIFTNMAPGSVFSSVGGTRAVGIGWLAGDYGIGWIDTEVRFAVADSNLIKKVGPTSLTAMTPATDTTSPDIAVVGALDRFVVVWVDQHKPATTEIWIAAVDPNTATASIAKQASLDDPAKKKFFPRVVYDVSSDTVAVAWIEMDLATTNFNVMFTRYSRDLQTRLPTAPMSVNAGTLQAKQVAIGFAVGKQNEYGLAYRSLDNRAYFSKVNCQGP